MHLSRRLPSSLSPSRLTEQLERHRIVYDLTESNPTRVGLAYDPRGLREALLDEAVLRYEPHSLGLEATRMAAAAWLRARGVPVGMGDVALTASTSEAYAVLIKLLCDPDDAVACPEPSYPLVPHLARLEGVRTIAYDLKERDGRFGIDWGSLEGALLAGSRAVIVINPNNPTGQGFTAPEREKLHALCRRYDVPIISDEVFAGYGHTEALLPSVAREDGALTFVLDGLSKSAALPQWKLGWIGVCGPEPERRRAMRGLEWVLDAYLSVSTPTQLAAPALIEAAAATRQQLLTRILSHRDALAQRLEPLERVKIIDADGGWYAVLRIDEVGDDDRLVLHLVEREGVLVQPGYFYDFAEPGYVVVSLIPPAEVFSPGIEALARGIGAFCAL